MKERLAPYAGVLQILLGEFRDKVRSLKTIVSRDAQFPHAPNKIKVAIGMRRSGKTYFLYQQILSMMESGVDITAILYLNFEDDRLLPLNEKKLAGLVDAFYSLYPENHDRKCFFFFDEIQNVHHWPIVIRRLNDTKNAEIFLTGSSAKLLSKEIATSLRGRSLAVEIWPYSFSEFLRAKQTVIDRSLYDKRTQDKLLHVFHSYLTEGGFPEIVPFAPDVRQQTLQEYLDVVILRDIVERHAISRPSIIKYLILTLMHNVSKPFTVNKFYNDAKSQGYRIGKDVLYEYMDHIEDAYLAFPVPIYDKSVRKIQTNPKKIYAVDPGLARSLTLEYENELGRLFENIVFLDLKRLGAYLSYYSTSEGYEIDFLAQFPRGRKKLFQVVWDMQDSKTEARESRALEAAMKELQIDGEIVTLDSFLQKGLRF